MSSSPSVNLPGSSVQLPVPENLIPPASHGPVAKGGPPNPTAALSQPFTINAPPSVTVPYSQPQHLVGNGPVFTPTEVSSVRMPNPEKLGQGGPKKPGLLPLPQTRGPPPGLPLPEMLSGIPTPVPVMGHMDLNYMSSVPPPDLRFAPPPMDFRSVPPPQWNMRAPPPHFPHRPVIEAPPRPMNVTTYQSELDMWFSQIKEYEQKMNNYFEQCSGKLHEWHRNGGSQTEEYEKEYSKLMDEYQRHAEYMRQMREYYAEQVQAASGATAAPPPPQDLPPPPPPTEPPTNTALIADKNVAKSYSQYYKDMISYFKGLLEAQGEDVSMFNIDLPGTAAARATPAGPPGKEKKRPDKKKGNIAKGGPERSFPPVPSGSATISAPGRNFSSKNSAQIMNDFREAFGGKFDWAHWHSYMSTISRTDPEWYEMFKEQSKGLSIDWDKMYTDWAVAEGVVPNLPNKPPTVTETPANPTVAPPPAGQSQEHESEDDEDEDDDWTFCTVCDQHFTQEAAYTRHLRGMTHTQRVLDAKKAKKPEEFAEEVRKEEIAQAQEPSPHEKHMEWLMEQCKMQRVKGLGLSGSFFCTLCTVEVTSQKALQFHLNGRKHLSNLEIVKATGAMPPTETHHTKKKASIRIQNILDTCVEPLIGLNYVTEYQREDPSSQCCYFCELCDSRFEGNKVLAHLTGAKHRRTYIKFNYPDLHEILDQDSSTLAKMKRLEVFAKKIEEHEGRKKMSIKMEIANNAVKEKKRSEAFRKRKEILAKERQAAEDLARLREKQREDRRKARMQKREEDRRQKAIAWLLNERKRRLAKGRAEEDMDALEDGEIASDAEEEYVPDEHAIRRAMHRFPRSYSESESSEEELFGPPTKTYASDDEENNLGASLVGGSLEAEDDYDELEMAEFEDVYQSKRPPLALHLPADSERDDFIRRIKEKRLFQLKQLDDKSVEHFLLEAEWALQRAKKQMEIKESISKSKQKQEELHNRPSGFHGPPPTGVLLPPLNAPMGPVRPPYRPMPPPGVFYPGPPRPGLRPPFPMPMRPPPRGFVEPGFAPQVPVPALEPDSMERMMQSIYSMTGLPGMRRPAPLDIRKRGPILPTPPNVEPKRFRETTVDNVGPRPGLLIRPAQPDFSKPPPLASTEDTTEENKRVDFYSALHLSEEIKAANQMPHRTVSDIKSDLAAELRAVAHHSHREEANEMISDRRDTFMDEATNNVNLPS